MAPDVAQRERSNIKCYVSTFSIIYIYIDAKPLNMFSLVVMCVLW